VGYPAERVPVDVDARTPAYLVLSDTFAPGWSATVDGRPTPIRPAYVAFRAVPVSPGQHTVVFTYRPAGFTLGLGLTGWGVVAALVLWFRPRRAVALAPDHAALGWPRRWRTWWFLALAAGALASAVSLG